MKVKLSKLETSETRKPGEIVYLWQFGKIQKCNYQILIYLETIEMDYDAIRSPEFWGLTSFCEIQKFPIVMLMHRTTFEKHFLGEGDL